ncbi:phage head closure protein [Variovorax sp. EBFNA2]|uniref:phage head closure protein n=1 Tax=Variovorax sp. EBFNA2 TaxID=3342097 RepID=UPI0029BFD6E3|nr:phage head closure protein [Variovorax boronicumulans]WPG35136.1 phage head closure protein [Variovorax boronicumulans]
MLAPKYRHRVTIQDQVSVQDQSAGDETLQWVDVYVDVPAECLTGAGREAIHAQTVEAPTDARINFRWLPGVEQRMRVVWDGANYNITGMDTDSTGRRELRLKCQKGLTDGR